MNNKFLLSFNMFDLIGKKWLFFIFSGLIIMPGIISLGLYGVRPAIDFTGGSLLEIQSPRFKVQNPKEEINGILKKQNIEAGSVQRSGDDVYLLRLKPINKDQNQKLQKALESKFEEVKEIRFETVGPTIGRETTGKAAKAILIVSVAIIIYIALAFRKIPKPYSSFRFGICAVAALIHDVLLLIGLFSLFGRFLNVEIDGLFITALLAIMGFSVHDSIVVFDRVRENLRKMQKTSFEHVVNESILQTLTRSLSISLTVVFTLISLLLFGGETIRWFIVALLIGMVSGTYSSIFNAAPLLVAWEEKIQQRKNKGR